MTLRRRGPHPEGFPEEFLPDCELLEKPETAFVLAPERNTRVKVLKPYSVAYNGTAYWPGSVAEVPASVAEKWLLNKWVTLST
jgi:hypothetical protein